MRIARRALALTSTLLALALLASVLGAPSASAPDQRDSVDPFTGRTLRYDYFHSGQGGAEIFSPDGFRVEGPWAGPLRGSGESVDLGAYRYELVDEKSGTLLHAQGFGSIYDEWTTTREALDGGARTFHESFRFPEPRHPALVRVLKRLPRGRGFETRHEVRFEPGSLEVDASPPPGAGVVLRPLFENGPGPEKVDLLVLGDGYVVGEQERFFEEARQHVEALFAVEPFARRREDFNVRALVVPAEAPGIRDPRRGKWRASPLGLSYNALGSDRYVLTLDNRSLREIAANAPYDVLVILFDERKYGGGGIYNLWATCAADSSPAPYLIVHELGHSFAGLADEYYTSQVAYEDLGDPDEEPWSPNATANPARAELKWGDLVDDDTPLPTPWQQKTFDELSLGYQAKRAEIVASGGNDETMEALFAEVREKTLELFESEPHAGRVGAFQGASYRAEGLYRPALDCIMFSRNPSYFCPVCERAIEASIDAHIEARRQ